MGLGCLYEVTAKMFNYKEVYDNKETQNNHKEAKAALFVVILSPGIICARDS